MRIAGRQKGALFLNGYSPDGTKIAFVSHRNGASESKYADKLQEIKNSMDVSDMDSVSKAIHSLQHLEEDSDIYIGDSSGGNLKKLTSNKGSDTSVRWSPCGKYLVYASGSGADSKDSRLKILNIESTAEIKLDYDRKKLLEEIHVDPDESLNNDFFSWFVPDFIERPYMMRMMGKALWGREQWPDWTS